jgi:hypothetical protein
VGRIGAVDVVVDLPVLGEDLGFELGIELLVPIRCSSRMRPLNDAIQAFCQELPGSSQIERPAEPLSGLDSRYRQPGWPGLVSSPAQPCLTPQSSAHFCWPAWAWACSSPR